MRLIPSVDMRQVVECSFIGAAGMTDEEADTQGIQRGHTSWRQLQVHVVAHPEIVFVLCHFSKRYTDVEIEEYFRSQQYCCNIVLWLDSGIIDFSQTDWGAAEE